MVNLDDAIHLADSKGEVVAEGDKDEIFGDRNGPSAFIVGKHGENRDAFLGCEVVEAALVHVGKHEVLGARVHRVVRILAQVGGYSRDAFGEVAAIGDCLAVGGALY